MRYYDSLENYMETGVNLQGNVTFQQQYGKTSIYSSLTRMNDQSQMTRTIVSGRVMRGERVPPGTRWTGNPISPWAEEESG